MNPWLAKIFVSFLCLSKCSKRCRFFCFINIYDTHHMSILVLFVQHIFLSLLEHSLLYFSRILEKQHSFMYIGLGFFWSFLPKRRQIILKVRMIVKDKMRESPNEEVTFLVVPLSTHTSLTAVLACNIRQYFSTDMCYMALKCKDV